MSSLSATCNTRYTAYHNSGHRDVSEIRWIVMHDTEGGTAQSIAHYFSTPAAGGSAHLVVDDNDCYRCVPNDVIAWGAPGANTRGFHIEQCGYAHWTTSEWKAHGRMLDRAAYKAAFHCHKFGIPPQFVYADGLRRGDYGITTHAEVTKAFPGGSHTDPGAGWPRRLFMSKVRFWYQQLDG